MKHTRLFIFASLILIMSGSASSVNAAILEPNVTSKAAVVADLHTGQVISDKNGSERLPIASISKLILIYMIEQAIQDNKIKRNQVVKIPQKVATFSDNSMVANVPMSTTMTYTVKQLEKAALLPSSNSAALALVNLIADSQSDYYKKAEKLLDSWGIKHAKIVSASGLSDGDLGAFSDPNTPDDKENKLSAREVAIIAKKLVDNFPNITKITSLTTAEFPTKDGLSQTIFNTDQLLDDSIYKFEGLKTGTTPYDGGNFVGLTYIGSEPVITVMLNSEDVTNNKVTFNDTLLALNEITEKTAIMTVNNAPKHRIANAKVKNGDVRLQPTNKNRVFVRLGAKFKVTSKIEYKNVSAPLKKGQLIGKRKLTTNNPSVNDFLTGTPLIKYAPSRDIDEANIFTTGYRNFIGIFN